MATDIGVKIMLEKRLLSARPVAMGLLALFIERRSEGHTYNVGADGVDLNAIHFEWFGEGPDKSYNCVFGGSVHRRNREWIYPSIGSCTNNRALMCCCVLSHIVGSQFDGYSEVSNSPFTRYIGGNHNIECPKG